MRGDLIGELAKELMGRPNAHLASLESLNLDEDGIDAVRVEIRDAPITQTGKNAGRPNWRKSTNTQVRIIVRDELQRLAAAWSERTGKCISCAGTGQHFVRWSSSEGTRYRPCPTCGGSGLAA